MEKIITPERIEGDRIYLQKPKPSFELATIGYNTAMESYDTISRYLNWIFDFSPESYYNHLSSFENSDKHFGYIIYDKDNNFMGFIDLHNYHSEPKYAEFGYWISDKYTGHGYMMEAVALMEKEFSKILGIQKFIIMTNYKNTKSQNVALKSGYELEAVLKRHTYCKYEDKIVDANLYVKFID